MKLHFSSLHSCVMVTVLLFPTTGYSQIEEIVVTAQKREENLQETPIAITAFTEESLEGHMINDISKLADFTPNVIFDTTTPIGGLSNGAAVFIRGIGQWDFAMTTDPGVGTYIDGVYSSRAAGGVLDVVEIERIEILRGSQGTLFGRNTIGGALKYVSREPDNETRMRVEGKLGEDSLRKVRANLSGALVEDTLFGSFAISSTNHDGYQTNLYDGSEFAGADRLAVRGSLIWQASESLRFKLVGDILRDDSDPYVPTRVAVNLGGPSGLGAFGALLSTANLFVPGAAYLAPGQMLDASLPTNKDHVNTAFIEGGFDEYELDTTGVSLTIDWDLNDAWSLKSVTALRDGDFVNPFDFDGTHQVFINTLRNRKSRDWSQELQLH